MNKEFISSKQSIALLIMFILGSSVVTGVSKEALQDSWISVILGCVMALPLVFIYARLIKIYPSYDLFEMIIEIFGKVIGKIVVILFTWYALHIGSLVIRNFGEFIETTSLPETPQLPIYLILIILSAYVLKSGIETFGKAALIFVPILFIVLLSIIILSIKDFNYANLQPGLAHGTKKIFNGAFSDFSFPFAETVLFLAIFNSIKPKDSPYKVYFLGILIGGLLLLAIIIKNILVIGFPLIDFYYFPNYAATKIINVGEGDIISRIEGTISASFILTGFVKVGVCLFAASKGISKLFNINNYRQMVFPASLIMLTLACIVYKSIMEMFDFITIYKYYAFPFQVIIPVLMFIIAEIKFRRRTKKPLVSSII